eukprot:CAMPEP_0114625482 /NCGR_PEP_ID=MMETSP0168-20121206/11293_1 /TAXON_ID=95228 ORGANISM="Vannella sp., Strain DIVA3 517/6/12" /NCGR_SAMPLE_ID=MMETSP0168 /ASSEMBLY_ACC=CAM_ASM_000044 /LENGTH=104 /DNA_ID=CAMNT_0001836765 /DNA_START=185 /DNA_END=499 /DNA_ORIENTATION=-
MATFKCGRNKAWLDPSASAEIAKATTRADIRELVDKGLIKYVPRHPWKPQKKQLPSAVVERKVLRSRERNRKRQVYWQRQKNLDEQRQLRDEARVLYKELYETS